MVDIQGNSVPGIRNAGRCIQCCGKGVVAVICGAVPRGSGRLLGIGVRIGSFAHHSSFVAYLNNSLMEKWRCVLLAAMGSGMPKEGGHVEMGVSISRSREGGRGEW